MKKRWHFYGILIASLYALTSQAHIQPSSQHASLYQVQEKIKNIEKTLYDQQHEEQQVHKQLADIEKEWGHSADKLRELEKKKQSHEVSLQKFSQQRATLEKTHQTELATLAHLVQSEFQHQRKEKLRLLLEQREWSHLSRLNTYFQHFYHARTQRLAVIKENLTQLQTVHASLKKEQIAIDTLTLQIKSKQRHLKSTLTERQKLLSSLAQKRLKTSDKLSQLQKQEAHLNQAVKAIKGSLAVTPSYIDPVQNIAKMKKKLQLPIHLPHTTLALIPHAKKANAKKTYIEAPEGTPVNAIFPGKVVFAEWLRGVGLLIILDHGNGYMSLYGNNETLYKSLGDTVNQGEMISRVGQSGGQAKPGLYFEIRKDGETLDPTPWFKT